MSTALMIADDPYQKVADAMAFVKECGTMIAKSRFFGCENEFQGQALALIAFTEKLPILELRRRYHIIGGDLSMRAEFMRSELRRIGGDYDWVNDAEDGGGKATMWIEFRGRKHEVSYSLDEAKAEGLVKKDSRWIKNPPSMLRARCSSKAITMYASEVRCGFYTEEDLGKAIVEDGEAAKAGNGKTTAAAADKPKPTPAADPNVIEGEFVAKQTEAKSEVQPGGGSEKPPLPAGTTEPQYATHSQVSKIEGLLNKLGATPESREKMLHKRKVNSLRSLTIGQADELVVALAQKLTEVKLAGGTVNPAETPVAPPTPPGPCSIEQQSEAKQRLQELKQVNPPAFGGFVDWLKSKNLKIEHLSARDCDNLIAAAKDVKLMDDFFAKSLEEWKPKESATTSPTLAEPPAGDKATDKPADAAAVTAAANADVPFETSSSKN